MTIMPPGTIDPSPFLYNNTMYTMAGLVSVASALHFMVRPVNQKYFEKEETKQQWFKIMKYYKYYLMVKLKAIEFNKQQ